MVHSIVLANKPVEPGQTQPRPAAKKLQSVLTAVQVKPRIHHIPHRLHRARRELVVGEDVLDRAAVADPDAREVPRAAGELRQQLAARARRHSVDFIVCARQQPRPNERGVTTEKHAGDGVGGAGGAHRST